MFLYINKFYSFTLLLISFILKNKNKNKNKNKKTKQINNNIYIKNFYLN